jgi:hypothetical protein
VTDPPHVAGRRDGRGPLTLLSLAP